MRERKDTWIKPKTTYCKDVDIFRSAVDDRNQFNGEWFTQIQLTVKKEMAWINDGTAVLQLNARIPFSLSFSLSLSRLRCSRNGRACAVVQSGKELSECNTSWWRSPKSGRVRSSALARPPPQRPLSSDPKFP
jgi:hypothetical protein